MLIGQHNGYKWPVLSNIDRAADFVINYPQDASSKVPYGVYFNKYSSEYPTNSSTLIDQGSNFVIRPQWNCSNG